VLIPQRLHRIAMAILAEHIDPLRVGLAVWLGIVVGFTPFYGFHFFICVGFAFLFRLNKVIVYAAAHISSPPFVPLLAFTSVQLGSRLIYGRWAFASLAQVRARPLGEMLKEFFTDWLLGGLVAGVVLGLLAGVIAFVVLSLRAPFELRAAAARYKKTPRKFRSYAWFKYRMDPCYTAVAAHIPKAARVLDLGAGIGMLAALLQQRDHSGEISLVEWDNEKAACARDVTGLQVVCGDAWSAALPMADAITLIDILHYRDAAAQRELLARVRDALSDNGSLFIREHDADRRARFTRWVERIAVHLGWNKASSVHFRSAEALSEDLRGLGFSVRLEAVSGPAHPGNVLFVAQRAQSEVR
jgi:uncharacterized protein (DUF2062 family)/protein-L-isoaspartate O-methyltransferase